MLWGGHHGGLELRDMGGGETRLSGRFPYGREAVLSDGGRDGRALVETIAARAFAGRIDSGEDIHLLVGHDYDRPLASREAGSLDIRDADGGVAFDARIAPEMAGVSWVRDLLAAVRSGLILGLSPGFRVARRAGAERIEERTGGTLRTVAAADLFEFSAVTRPAYPDAQIEARAWSPGREAPDAGLARQLSRWRL